MSFLNITNPLGRFRAFLGKTGLLPPFMGRSETDRRAFKDRRVGPSNDYLINEGADRRFEPDRRRNIERRAGSLSIEDLDIQI